MKNPISRAMSDNVSLQNFGFQVLCTVFEIAPFPASVTLRVFPSNSPEINILSPHFVLWGVPCGRTTPSARSERSRLPRVGRSNRNRPMDSGRCSHRMDSRSRCRARTPRALRFSLPTSLWLSPRQASIIARRAQTRETRILLRPVAGTDSRRCSSHLPQETAAASNRSQLAAKQESKLEILGLSLPPFVRPMESERRVKATSLLAAAFEKGEQR